MGTEVLHPHDCLRSPAPAPAPFPLWRAHPNPKPPRRPSPPEGRRRMEGSPRPAKSRGDRRPGEPRRREAEETAVYAGTACSVSPSPSSLPLPSFFRKRDDRAAAVDYSATRDLRRLLRLD